MDAQTHIHTHTDGKQKLFQETRCMQLAFSCVHLAKKELKLTIDSCIHCFSFDPYKAVGVSHFETSVITVHIYKIQFVTYICNVLTAKLKLIVLSFNAINVT